MPIRSFSLRIIFGYNFSFFYFFLPVIYWIFSVKLLSLEAYENCILYNFAMKFIFCWSEKMNKLSLFLLFLCTISVKSFAQSIANHAKTDTALVKSFIKKASKFVTLNSDSASYYLNKVDFMTKDYKVSVERSHYLQVLGNQYKFYKKFDEAEKTYEKRLEIAGRLKNREDHVFSSIHALASIYVEKGQYIKAATNYLLLEDRLLNSLAKRPLQNGDLYQESLLFKTYCNLCLVYHRLKNKTRNQYYLKKLSPLIRTASDSLYYYYAMATYLPNERRSQYYLMGLEFLSLKMTHIQ